MKATLKEIIGAAKELPEECFEEALEKLRELKEKTEAEKEKEPAKCIKCGSDKVVKNGNNHNKQAYICRNCGKSFTETAKSAIAYSHSSATVWKQVIADTVKGIAIDKTAEGLDLSHATVFNMRHKILYCIEQSIAAKPVELRGVCEADETYVLESVKGRKIGEEYHRKPRKHGAVASKRGVSEEYICLCTSVTGEGENIAEAVNRATPSSQEIVKVFGGKITDDTVILCDGAQSYNILEEKCRVAVTQRVNKVNGFHSFIKQRLDSMCGVATAYLNRYSAFFSKIYASDDSVVDYIFGLMTSRSNSFSSISNTLSKNLLSL